jgi:hypothetical protein
MGTKYIPFVFLSASHLYFLTVFETLASGTICVSSVRNRINVFLNLLLLQSNAETSNLAHDVILFLSVLF